MKTTITLIDTNGNLHDVKLTLKDIMNMQTKESKRTFVLGTASTAVSITSMLLPKSPAKYVALGIGLVGTIATIISNNDSIQNATSQENLDHINNVLREIAKREGFEYVG